MARAPPKRDIDDGSGTELTAVIVGTATQTGSPTEGAREQSLP